VVVVVVVVVETRSSIGGDRLLVIGFW